MPARLTHQERAIEEIRRTIRYKHDEVGITDLDITEIPEEIMEVPRLKAIHILRCKITSLPECLRRCTQLRTLNLTLNKITHLPEWLPELEKLETLNLDHNHLRSLPASFGQFKRLKYLDLNCNEIAGFPVQLVNNKELVSLCIARNPLGNLPDSISELRKLEELDADGTGLTSLPASMLEMKRLTYVQFERNPGLRLPAAIVGKNGAGNFARKVLKYYFTEIVAPPEGTKAKLLEQKPDMFDKVRDSGTAWERFSTEQIIRRLKKWSRLCSFVIDSATRDTIELTFQTLPEDMDAFVRDIDKLCPDVLSQGFGCYADVMETETDEEDAGLALLKQSLQQEMKLILWWD